MRWCARGSANVTMRSAGVRTCAMGRSLVKICGAAVPTVVTLADERPDPHTITAPATTPTTKEAADARRTDLRERRILKTGRSSVRPGRVRWVLRYFQTETPRRLRRDLSIRHRTTRNGARRFRRLPSSPRTRRLPSFGPLRCVRGSRIRSSSAEATTLLVDLLALVAQSLMQIIEAR
jgi:hypothetical protein